VNGAWLRPQDQAVAELVPPSGFTNKFGATAGAGEFALSPGNNVLVLLGEDALGQPVDLAGSTIDVELTPQSKWVATV
jgi:hypothetical protein